jgi:hypothetical protein
MRVVVDTNIFVSAALKEASWPRVVVRWLDRFGGLLKSAARTPPACHGRTWSGHPRLWSFRHRKSWMAGTSPAMTQM